MRHIINYFTSPYTLIILLLIIFLFYFKVQYPLKWIHFCASVRCLLLRPLYLLGLKKHIPFASAYLKNKKIYIWSSALTKDGLRVGVEPCFEYDENAGLEDIGKALISALDGNQFQFNQVPDYNAHLIKTGSRSEKDFMENCFYCGIERNSKEIIFIPTLNGGKWFQDIKEKIFSIPTSSELFIVGQSIKKGLLLSEIKNR